MKIQFLKDHDGDYTYGTCYLHGDIITLPDANARMLIQAGVCTELKAELEKHKLTDSEKEAPAKRGRVK